MSKNRFELNGATVRQMLKSSGVVGALKESAQRLASNAGPGYEVWYGPNRANVAVRAATEAAEQDNLENNTLLKAGR